ncbi:MAG: hypothetical protein NTZ63_01000, partial [Candidatus Omnitrophica bacterium]|nr:hypothetical protein [Candidatus Omnitrophota bacterium]
MDDTTAGDVAKFGLVGDEIELDINSLGAITTGELNLTNSEDITLGAITTTSGGVTVNAGTHTINFNGTVTVAASQNFVAIADDMGIDTAGGVTINVSGTGTVLLEPLSSDRAINIVYDPANPPGGFDLTEAELQAISCSTTVTIGQQGGTGVITIGNDTAGGLDLSGESFNLTLNGGVTTIEQEITIRNGGTLDFNLTGALIDSNGATAADSDIIFGATGSNTQTGFLNITSVGGVGTAIDPLEVQVGDGSITGNMLTLSVDNGNVDASTSVIAITTKGPTTLLYNITNNDQGNIAIIAGSPLIIDAHVLAKDNGNISLSNTGAGDITINENIEIKAELGDISINSANSIVVEDDGTGILIQTGGDGEIDLTANATTGDITLGYGTASSNLLINQTGTGTVDINAGDDIAISRIVTSGGPVTIDASGSADANITLYGAVNASSVNLGAIDAAGTVVVNADENITVSSLIKSDSTVDFTFNKDGVAEANNMIVGAQLRGSIVTIQDGTTGTGEVTISTDPNNVDGAITFNNTSTGGVDLNANVTALGNVTFSTSTPVDLDAGATVTSTTGGVTFGSTIKGGQALTVNAVSGTVTFTGIVGGTPLTSLTVNADTAILHANISTADLGNVDFRGTDVVTLTEAVTIDTAQTGLIGGDILFKSAGTINGAYALSLDAGGSTSGGAIQLGIIGNTTPLASLTVDNNGTVVGITTLYGNITANTSITFTDAKDVNLAADISLLGDGSTDMLLNGSNVAGDYNLTVNTGGSGTVTLGLTATETEIDVNALTVTSSGQTNIAGNITTDEGMNFSGASNVDFTTAVTLTNTVSGVIDLSGGAVDGGQALVLNAGAGNIVLAAMGQGAVLTSLDVNSTGTTQLGGNINTTAAMDFGGATEIELSANVVLDADN